MTAQEIQQKALEYIRRSPTDIVLPNFYWGRFEMDVFKLSKSGLVTEYEIKISRGDYFADFIKGFWQRNDNGIDERVKKHDHIKSGERCSRFYFIAPECMLEINELPDYVGLITTNEFGGLKTVKHARLLSSKKVDPSVYMEIANTLSFMESNLRYKLSRLSNKAKGL